MLTGIVFTTWQGGMIMKKMFAVTLIVLMGGISAQADWIEDLGGAVLEPGTSFGGAFAVPDGPAVDGMDVSFDITGISGNATWASDMKFTITGPSGSSYAVGGFTSPAANNWDFDGSASTNDGSYFHSVANPFDSNGDGTTDSLGTWTWEFEHNWLASTATVTISNLSVRLSQVPEPSSLLLASAACLGLLRRRKR